MSIKISENGGCLDVIMDNVDGVELATKTNRQLHWDFKRLNLGYHTPIRYSEIKGV